jgi:hypothetical protein
MRIGALNQIRDSLAPAISGRLFWHCERALTRILYQVQGIAVEIPAGKTMEFRGRTASEGLEFFRVGEACTSRIRHESMAQHDNWQFITHESDNDTKIEALIFLLRCVRCYVLQIYSPVFGCHISCHLAPMRTLM